MNIRLKKMSITLIAVLCFAGCSQGKADNKPLTIDSLNAHLLKTESTLKIYPMAEAFAGLVSDPAQQQEMIDKAKAGYAEMNIQEIYLVTATTAVSNEAAIGSLIHFNKKMTIDEAKAQLAKDTSFKDQAMDIFMNGNFAYAVSIMDGERLTPKSIITAFQNF